MPQNCYVPECKKKVYVENGVKISFHTFPEEKKLFMKLIVAIRRYIGKHFQVTKHTRVCSRHFKPSHYLPSLAGRKRTVFLEPQETPFLSSITENLENTTVEQPADDSQSIPPRTQDTEKALGTKVNSMCQFLHFQFKIFF